MRDRTGFQTLLLVTPSLFLLLPFSCLVFALERISNAVLLTQTTRTWRFDYDDIIQVYGRPNSTTEGPERVNLPVSFDLAPTFAILAVAVVAFIVSIIATCGIWDLRKIEGSSRYQRGWAWSVIIADFVTAVASIAVLAWTSAVQRNQGWKSYNDVQKRGQRFTRETWTCQIDKFYPNEGWAGHACGLAKATRFMLIALALCAILVIVTTWVLVRDRGGMSWLWGGKGRYGAFPNSYEMHAPPQMYAPAPPQQMYAPPQQPQMYAPQQQPQMYGPPQPHPPQNQGPISTKGTNAPHGTVR